MKHLSFAVIGLTLLAGCKQGVQDSADVPTYDATSAPVVMPQAVYGTTPTPAPADGKAEGRN